MISPTGGLLRFMRAGAIACVVVALSVVAHVVGGGHRPSMLPLLLAGVLTGSVVLGCTRRRLNGGVIGGLLAFGQIVFHAMFVVFGNPACEPASAAGSGHHHDMAASCLSSVSDLAATATHAPLSAGMLAAHAVTSTVATVLLVHGERMVWAIWAWLTCAVVEALPSIAVPPERPRPAWFFEPVAVAFVPRGEYRRGPPPALALAR